MVMQHVIQNGYNKMRTLDVTADDAALDGLTKGNKYTDITTRDIFEFDTGANVVEIMFSGEGIDTDKFGAEIWNVTLDGLAEFVADVTGTAGKAIADMTDMDNTSRLFCDDVSVIDSDHLKSVAVADQGNDRYSKISYAPFGAKAGYIRFYNVGGAGEVKRIVPRVRFF